jgi:restriction system protein
MARGGGLFEDLRAVASKLSWQGIVAPALASFVKRVTGTRLFDDAVDDTPGVVKAMEWRNFELLICGALRQEGYRVEERGGSGPNGEIDLIATKARQRLLIQCKHWKTSQVGVSVIRELHGVVAARRADGGIVVTGGGFTKEARDFARGCRIRLIGGDSLQQIIAAQMNPRTQLLPQASAAPRCPKCGAGMVDYVARQGKFAGKHFWACSLYPKCTGIALAVESEEQTRGSHAAA